MTLPLRQRVLRPHLDQVQCRHQGDNDPHSHHFGAFIDGTLTGVASIFKESLSTEKSSHSWRLRGMAVLRRAQKIGVGEKLLRSCLEFTTAKKGIELWCYSRKPAIPFYEKFGFNRKGCVFNFPDVGPVILMEKLLKTNSGRWDIGGTRFIHSNRVERTFDSDPKIAV